jgi:hypothetical protein
VFNSRWTDIRDGILNLVLQSRKTSAVGDSGSTFLIGKHHHKAAETFVQNGQILVEMIQDLMMEVESLRAALAELTQKLDLEEDPYARAYLETARLSHNSAGPLSGQDKLLELFYPWNKEDDGRNWREAIMMRRLGLSEEEIGDFKREAAQAEMYT